MRRKLRKTDRLKVQLTKHGSQWIPTFRRLNGEEVETYMNFSDYDPDELMRKIQAFFPNAEEMI